MTVLMGFGINERVQDVLHFSVCLGIMIEGYSYYGVFVAVLLCLRTVARQQSLAVAGVAHTHPEHYRHR